MREIKFRAKRLDNGEWIYGFYNRTYTYEQGYKDCIFNHYTGFIEVMPETVGQFTGLLDGNGQEIFEGDIMRIPETEFNIEIIGVVEFDRGSYVVRSFLSGTYSSLAWAIRERQSGERRGVVIGNIYDNPEMLNKRD